jgi:hypothetical protein
MKNRSRFLVTSIFAVLIFGWLGFLVHTSPRFAGSGLGSAFGIAGAALMLVSASYVVVKRIPAIKRCVSKLVAQNTLISIHIYTGIVGALLGLIHTGHKYDSPLGIALTAMMLLVIVSGFTVKYLLPYVTTDMKDKLALLQTARGDLDSAWGVLESSPRETKNMPKRPLLAAGLASLGLSAASEDPASRVTTLAEGVADLEYSVRTHELLKRWFSWALILHNVTAFAFLLLLALHIWASIHFGLRWYS